jgi:hypothetical protein
MGPVLNGLIKLQSVENRLRAAQSKLNRCRRTVIFQENQLRTLQNSLEAKKEEIKLTRVQADRLELELRSRQEDIDKYKAALNAAKSNKEYSAILTELNTSKADNSKIENQVLELMKNIETDEQECEQIKEQIEEQKSKLDELRKTTEQAAKKHEEEIESIKAEWDKVAEGIPNEALDIFKRVAETYDGEAIAFIEEHEEKNAQSSCGGCYMGLTMETVNQLMTKDDIFRCPTCSRILVLRPENENI